MRVSYVILRHTHASTVPVRTKYVQHLSLLASSLPFDPPRNSFDFYPRPKPPQTLSPSTRASLESPSNVSYPAGLACPTLPPISLHGQSLPIPSLDAETVQAGRYGRILAIFALRKSVWYVQSLALFCSSQPWYLGGCVRRRELVLDKIDT
jgi:hypothetical protein